MGLGKVASKKYMIKIWEGEDWAYTLYDPCKANYPNRYYDKEKYCSDDQTTRSEPLESEEDT